MKKIIAVLLIAMSASAGANGYRHHNHGYRYNNYNWVAPAIIGGAVVYGLTRPYYYAPPPVVIQEPPVYIQQPNPALPPYGYHYETILDNACNCYRTVLVPN